MSKPVLVLFALMSLAAALPAAYGQQEPVRDYELAVTKGLEELQAGNAAGAAVFFRQALAAKPKDRNAALSLGISLAKANDPVAARAALEDAQAVDPADPRIKYELGVVLAKLGEQKSAQDCFAFAASSPLADPSLRDAAQDALAKLAGPPAGPKLSVAAGVEHDSNVILEPAVPVTPSKEKKSDWAAIVAAEGAYRFAISGTTAGQAWYRFYQSVHDELEDFNVQQHTLGAALRAQGGKAAVGGTCDFSYTLVGAKHYSTSNELMPYVEAKFTQSSTTRLRYLFRDVSYYDDPLFAGNSERSGASNTGGLTHAVQVGSAVLVSASYDFTAATADKDYWSYKEQYARLAVQVTAGRWAATASAAYRDTRYDAVVTATAGTQLYPEARHDGAQEYSVEVKRNLSARLSASLSDSLTLNDSNLAPFEYRRNIVGAFVEMHL